MDSRQTLSVSHRHAKSKFRSIQSIMLKFLCFACFFASMAMSAYAAEHPVGWCAFYPGVDVGMDKCPQSGASILSVPNSASWSAEQVEGKFDFSALAKQVEYAEKHNLKLARICEVNPVYAPAWLKEKVKAAGQNVKNSRGADGIYPITRPSSGRRRKNYPQDGRVYRQRDTNHVVEIITPAPNGGSAYRTTRPISHNFGCTSEALPLHRQVERRLGSVRLFDEVRHRSTPSQREAGSAKVLSLDLGPSTVLSTERRPIEGAPSTATLRRWNQERRTSSPLG